jgi:hypothetical protein
MKAAFKVILRVMDRKHQRGGFGVTEPESNVKTPSLQSQFDDYFAGGAGFLPMAASRSL